MRKPDFARAKTKAQISFAVTAKLISAFVFCYRDSTIHRLLIYSVHKVTQKIFSVIICTTLKITISNLQKSKNAMSFTRRLNSIIL